MPKAVPVTFATFKRIEEKLRKHGFRRISRFEIRRIIDAHGLIPPSQQHRPGEIGFIRSENGYSVKVWTSCLYGKVEACEQIPLLTQNEPVSRPVDEDYGWVLIVDQENQAQYFARPAERTKNFETTLIGRALVTLKKVQERPSCKECGKFMGIFEKPNGAVFWICKQNLLHADKKPIFKDWDFAIRHMPRAMRVVTAPRESHARSRKRARAEGHEPRKASTIRKGWRATRNPY